MFELPLHPMIIHLPIGLSLAVAVLAPIRAVLRLVRGDRDGFHAIVGSADIDAEITDAVHAAEGGR